ncbi:MAG: lysophospholipid acyltransferase family protein [Ferruginibacter sp.]
MQQKEDHKNAVRGNLFTEIFGSIWAVWGIVTFITTFLIFFFPSMLCYLMPEKKGQEYFLAVARIWMRIWLTLIGCPLKVKGKENFKPGQNYVVVFNHNALLDVPLSCPFVPGANKTIAKSSFAKVPLFGLFYKRGSVLVDRKSERSRQQSYIEMKTVLAKGMHMCLYPEGTRNRTGEPLKVFYDGAFKLAVESKKNVIPCVLVGTTKAMPINKTFYLFPTALKMTFLPEISSANTEAKALKEEVFSVMWEKYVKDSS